MLRMYRVLSVIFKGALVRHDYLVLLCYYFFQQSVTVSVSAVDAVSAKAFPLERIGYLTGQ